MTEFDLLVRGGAVVDGTGAEPVRADVGVVGDTVREVGDLSGADGVRTVEAAGRLVFPGFVDAHSHADAALADPDVQAAYLHQGVTTVLLGQDGVSFAPTDAASLAHAGQYFAAVDGAAPAAGPGQGLTVSQLLDSYAGSSALNAGYLVPAGTVRQRVVGGADRPASPAELDRMADLVDRAMADGALGLSTGLDYVPGAFADTAELTALCRPVARAGGAYVSHLRGYATDTVAGALAEAAAISGGAGVRAHVSHLHGTAAVVQAALDGIERDSGVRLSFDSYPYLRGSTIVAMLLLPTELQAGAPADTVRRLGDPAVRRALRTGSFPGNPRIGSITLSYLREPAWRWAEGLALADAADRWVGDHGGSGDLTDFVCAALAANGLAVGCVVENGADRTEADLRALLADPRQMASSDAIFLGSRPHPRGWGAFARLLARHTRDLGDWTWGQAARHLAGSAAERFRLAGRGRIAPGAAADLAVVDPAAVRDNATYADPRRPASGVSHVVVNGALALVDGAVTGVAAGRALRLGRGPGGSAR